MFANRLLIRCHLPFPFHQRVVELHSHTTLLSFLQRCRTPCVRFFAVKLGSSLKGPAKDASRAIELSKKTKPIVPKSAKKEPGFSNQVFERQNTMISDYLERSKLKEDKRVASKVSSTRQNRRAKSVAFQPQNAPSDEEFDLEKQMQYTPHDRLNKQIDEYFDQFPLDFEKTTDIISDPNPICSPSPSSPSPSNTPSAPLLEPESKKKKNKKRENPALIESKIISDDNGVPASTFVPNQSSDSQPFEGDALKSFSQKIKELLVQYKQAEPKNQTTLSDDGSRTSAQKSESSSTKSVDQLNKERAAGRKLNQFGRQHLVKKWMQNVLQLHSPNSTLYSLAFVDRSATNNLLPNNTLLNYFGQHIFEFYVVKLIFALAPNHSSVSDDPLSQVKFEQAFPSKAIQGLKFFFTNRMNLEKEFVRLQMRDFLRFDGEKSDTGKVFLHAFYSIICAFYFDQGPAFVEEYIRSTFFKSIKHHTDIFRLINSSHQVALDVEFSFLQMKGPEYKIVGRQSMSIVVAAFLDGKRVSVGKGADEHLAKENAAFTLRRVYFGHPGNLFKV